MLSERLRADSHSTAACGLTTHEHGNSHRFRQPPLSLNSRCCLGTDSNYFLNLLVPTVFWNVWQISVYFEMKLPHVHFFPQKLPFLLFSTSVKQETCYQAPHLSEGQMRLATRRAITRWVWENRNSIPESAPTVLSRQCWQCCPPVSQRTQVPPFMLHWNFNHFLWGHEHKVIIIPS